MISDSRPDLDATFIRHGLRRFLWVLAVVVIIVVVCVGGLVNVLVTGKAGGWLLVPLGLFVPLLLRKPWRLRHEVTALDGNGFWLLSGKQAALIPWDSLAGVGIYWARANKTIYYSLELCPLGETHGDDPLLGPLVREAEPLRSGLPRHRYRFDISDSFPVHEKALRRWAPAELWFGREERTRAEMLAGMAP
ncbi:hypothetical protein [Streptomyces sp. NPDC051554]|uniref:hypothetical protein n=1 Tax=Streptomyces sp. NPDC051554 TaxID=3365656 RepID=UPI0037971211